MARHQRPLWENKDGLNDLRKIIRESNKLYKKQRSSATWIIASPQASRVIEDQDGMGPLRRLIEKAQKNLKKRK
jgi:hypothetical protein